MKGTPKTICYIIQAVAGVSALSNEHHELGVSRAWFSLEDVNKRSVTEVAEEKRGRIREKANWMGLRFSSKTKSCDPEKKS